MDALSRSVKMGASKSANTRVLAYKRIRRTAPTAAKSRVVFFMIYTHPFCMGLLLTGDWFYQYPENKKI